MAEPFRESFEHTLAQIMRERTGSAWKVERLRRPAPAGRGELGSLAPPAEEGPLVDVAASPDKHAINR